MNLLKKKIDRKIPYLIKSLNGAYGKYIHSLQDIEAFTNKDDFKNIIPTTQNIYFFILKLKLNTQSSMNLHIL